ncbi:MAG TPA: hypothetical protein DHU55_07395, partial [Blastocatellia bacterium]|nr:hypothetical protein [Blastocatellia bacterium]
VVATGCWHSTRLSRTSSAIRNFKDPFARLNLVSGRYRYCVQTKLLLGMRHEAASLALVSMDEPEILQRLRAAFA